MTFKFKFKFYQYLAEAFQGGAKKEQERNREQLGKLYLEGQGHKREEDVLGEVHKVNE